MIIKSLDISNFRNHKRTKVELSSTSNVFIGKNAQGKTNLLEAIYFTCVGRGWRTSKDRDVINFDTEMSKIKTTVQKKFGDCSVEICISKTSKKSIKINGIPIMKMGELMGQVNCVFFSPDELRLIKDAPADRRKFLDIDISQIDKNYFYALLRYSKILLQRNALLKSKDEDIIQGLNIWDVQLARTGAVIISRRIDFINKLKDNIVKVHNFLTDGKEQIELSYINITSTESEEVLQTSSEDEIEKLILKRLSHARDKDLRLHTTTVGPHRDDIKILIDGQDVRHFASQGQQRTVALSIKLAELEIFKDVTGEMPVLLLDDVLSELDGERQKRLIKATSKCQSIITATTFSGEGPKIYKVDEGKVIHI